MGGFGLFQFTIPLPSRELKDLNLEAKIFENSSVEINFHVICRLKNAVQLNEVLHDWFSSYCLSPWGLGK